MRVLFWLSLVVILYGSLYPFDFTWPRLGDIDWREIVSANSAFDMVNNILLFAPTGLVAALVTGKDRKDRRQLLWTAFAIAVIAQVLQVFVPQRYPGLLDILMNAFGLGVGVAAAHIALKFESRQERAASGILFPVFLLFAFLAFQLYPYWPALDAPHLRVSLRLAHASLTRPYAPAFLQGLALWAAFYALLLPIIRRADWRIVFYLLVPTVYLARVLIWRNNPLFSEFVGALIGLGLMVAVSREPRRALIAVLLLGLFLVWDGVTPAFPRPSAIDFSWLPFEGFLHGNWTVNLVILMKKVFLYGALVWLMLIAGLRPWVVGVCAGLLLLSLEIWQVFYVSGRPEVTDPVLALLLLVFALGLGAPGSKRPGYLP